MNTGCRQGSRRLGTALLFGLAAGWAGASLAVSDDCWTSATTHAQQDRCQIADLERLDRTLNAVYDKALAALPAQDDDDPTQREQLRKSQRAWLIYTRENCALEGGLRGGSDAWVNTFRRACKAQALEERIAFLEKIAGHSGAR